MSDFDEEAEREKLREQFAEDDKKRESTERMSQLLLQGATMTNAHCDTCGDPLFRHEGRTFCATCQRAADNGTETATEPATTPDEPSGEKAAAERIETEDGQRIAVDERTATTDTARTGDRPAETAGESGRPAPDSQRAPPSQSASDADARSDRTEGGLGEAERSLTRTVGKQASAAENAGDLGRVREHLAAAREAAEALAAVRQASR